MAGRGARAACGAVRRIALLMNFAADDQEAPPRVSAFAQGLQERGWTVGGNVRIDYRWGAGDPEELVALAPDVILVSGTAAVGAVATGDLGVAASTPV